MVSRSRSVADPRWSPGGTRLAWVDSFDGRADLVVADPAGSGPPALVTASCGIGGGWCWAGDDAVVVGAADGRLVVLGVDGLERHTLTRDGRAFSPAVAVHGEVACAIERDDACDIAVVPLDGSAWPIVSPTPTTRGIPAGRPTVARSCGTSGTFRTCRGTGRASCAVMPAGNPR
jgi:hypothetical protein